MHALLKAEDESLAATSSHRALPRQSDRAHRNRLVEQALWVVRALAVELSRAYHLSISIDDLESYGRCGLLEAADTFDARPGTRFTTFAYYRIRGSMLDAIRAGAGHYTQSEMLCLRRLRAEGGADAADGGRNYLNVIHHHLQAELAASYLRDHDEETVSPHQLAEKAQVAAAVRAALGALPERERLIVQHLYFEPGASLATAAKRFGLDRSWLCRLHARALSELRRVLAELQP